MINFVREMAETANININEVNNLVGFSCLGGKVVVVNNYVKILTYASHHVVLKLKNDELVVEGEDITIRELNKNDICLVGNIARVYFAKEVKKYEKAE